MQGGFNPLSSFEFLVILFVVLFHYIFHFLLPLDSFRTLECYVGGDFGFYFVKGVQKPAGEVLSQGG